MFAWLFRIFGFATTRRKTTVRVPGSYRHRQVVKTVDSPKIRGDRERKRRQDGLRLVGIIAMGASVIGLGNMAVQETLVKNPQFMLKRIQVVTSGTLSPDQITAATGLHKGVNLLSLNLGEVRNELMKLPGIETATVTRDFEGVLTIDVTQRQAIAWLKCKPLNWAPDVADRGLLVDSAGIPFPAVTITADIAALPVIHDDTVIEVKLGAEVKGPRFVAALDLVKQLTPRDTDKARLVAILPPNKFALEAAFSDGASFTFSADGVTEQLQRYDQLRNTAQERGWTITNVNLVPAHNTPMVFKANPVPEAPQLQVPTPSKASSSTKKAKTSNTRRTNSRA